MKNLKWFLGLVLALTIFSWSATKVLAADEFSVALAQLKNAVGVLMENNVLAQVSPNFGYYVPSWERQQVLGVTVTACPISGQMWLCSDGSYPAVNNNEMTCANSGNPTCQSSSAGGTYTPPAPGSATGGCNPPANGCGSGMMWNQTNCSCQGDASQQNNSGTFFCYSLNRQATATECDTADKTRTTQPMICPAPPTNCPKWVVPTSGSGCGWCDYNSQPQPPTMTCPVGQQPECPSGAPSMINGAPTCPKAGEAWTCKSMNTTSCPYFNYCNGRVVKENGCDICKPNQEDQKNQNKPYQSNEMRPENFNDQKNQNEFDDNFDNGRVCTAKDAQADLRDAKRMQSEIKTLLKTKGLNADLKGKLVDLQNRANVFVVGVAKPNPDEDFCSFLEEWRQPSGDNDLNPNEELNNLRIVITFPTQLTKMKKELATVEKLVPKKKGVNKELLAKLTNFLSNMKTSISEAEAQFKAGEYDGLWDNLDFQQSGGPGDVRCVLDLSPMFEKIAGIKKMDEAIKTAMEDIRNTFYSSIDDEQFREACQIGNESRNIIEPFLRAKPVTSQAASTKLQNLRSAIENKYGGANSDEMAN